MTQKCRYGYLDILKIIAIMCVCLYHYPWIRHTGYVRPFPADVLLLRYFRGFDAICVPLFMMVNGALLLNRPFHLKKHAVRCISLFAGVYVWYLLTMALGHAWRSGLGYVAENWRGILESAQYLYEYDGIGTSHLWFVQMLVAVYLLVPLIRAAFDSREAQIQKGLLFFLGALGVFAFLLQDIAHVRAAVPVLRSLDLSGLDTVNPFRSMYGAMIVYFVLGGLLHRAHERMLSVPLWLCAAMVFFGSVVLFAEWYLVTIRTEAMYDIVFGGYSTLAALCMTCGAFIGAAISRRPVVIDGFISAVAALCAYKLCPNVRGYLIPSHASYEIGYRLAMDAMGLQPLFLLGMRLGEGSGCPLAFEVLNAACAIINDMATFDQAGIDDGYLDEIREGDKFTVEGAK